MRKSQDADVGAGVSTGEDGEEDTVTEGLAEGTTLENMVVPVDATARVNSPEE